MFLRQKQLSHYNNNWCLWKALRKLTSLYLENVLKDETQLICLTLWNANVVLDEMEQVADPWRAAEFRNWLS